jgi:hypothetical protein
MGSRSGVLRLESLPEVHLKDWEELRQSPEGYRVERI